MGMFVRFPPTDPLRESGGGVKADGWRDLRSCSPFTKLQAVATGC